MATKPATTYDGSTDYYQYTGSIGSDTQHGLFSCWFKRNGGHGAFRELFYLNGNAFYVTLNAANQIRVRAEDTASAAECVLATGSTAITDTDWHHIAIAIDLSATSANGFRMYLDGSDDSPTIATWVQGQTIDWTRPDYSVGSDSGGSNLFIGDISQLYWTNTWLDIDISANLAKLIDGSGYAPQLGPDGSWVTGAAALVYFPDGGLGNNEGSGGAFTENGTPASNPAGPTTTSVAPVVNYQEDGTGTFVDGTGTALTVTINLGATVDPTRTIVNVTGYNESGNCKQNVLRWAINTAGTQLTVDRELSAAVANRFRYQVLEFSQGVQVEWIRNVVPSTGVPYTQGISAITRTKTFPIFGTNKANNSYDDSNMFTVEIDAPHTCVLDTVNNSGMAFANWDCQIVEIDNATVEMKTGTLAAATTNNVGITAVADMAKTFICASAQSANASVPNYHKQMWELTAANNVQAVCSNAPGANPYVLYVVQVPANLVVSRGTLTIASTATSATATISPNCDPTKSIALGNGLYNFWGRDDRFDFDASDAQVELTITNASTLTGVRQAGPSAAITVKFEVLDFSEDAATRVPDLMPFLQGMM